MNTIRVLTPPCNLQRFAETRKHVKAAALRSSTRHCSSKLLSRRHCWGNDVFYRTLTSYCWKMHYLIRGTSPIGGQSADASYLQQQLSLSYANNTQQPINKTNQQQTRQFSSVKKQPCPFRTLNIPRDSTYSHAKKSFLKIAMKHHPDTFTSEDDCAEKRQKSQDIFMKCRSALESLVECESTGAALLKSEVETAAKARQMTNEEFDSWFEKETGHSYGFDLDPATMREVASMHENMEGSHGLDRDGGMWHLASLISSTVKSGKDSTDLLRLEAGSVEEEAKGKLDKRRRRVKGGRR